MKWQNGLDPVTNDAVIAKNKPSNIQALDDGGFVAQRASQIYSTNPWLKPETVLSLARAGATDDAVDAAGYISGVQQAESMPTESSFFGLNTVLKSVGKVFELTGLASKWVGKGLGLLAPDQVSKPLHFVGDTLYESIQDLKPVTRWGTAALDVIPELMQYGSAKTLGALYDVLGGTIEYGAEPQGGFWESTSIGQLLANPEEQGSGFFISETLREAQAREARARRGMINGSAFTTGRMVASTFFEPESTMYGTVSGVIDAVQMLILPDPTKLVTKGIRAATTTARGGLVPLVSEASRAESQVDDWLKALQEANPNTPASALIQFEAGIKAGLNGPQVDIRKFDTFMRSNPAAKRLVNQLIDEEDPGKIFSKVFRGQAPTDVAYNLSQAKTEDQVVAAMLGAYTYGNTPISRNLGIYAPRVTVMKPLANVKEFTKRSRLLAQVPDRSVVVAGDDLDNVKAVNAFANSAKIAGLAKEDVDELTTLAVKALRTGGSAVDRYELDGLYNTLITKSLRKNGVRQEVIDEILENDKASITTMRSYFRDRMGNHTDAGFMQAMLNVPAIKNSMQTQTWNDLMTRISTAGGGYGTDLHFEGAIQHLDLMNRMRVLPDHRVLRRLTRNPLVSEALSKLPGSKEEFLTKGQTVETFNRSLVPKAPILSKTEKREIIVNRKRFAEIDSEKEAIRTTYANLKQKLPQSALDDIARLDAEQAALKKVKRVKTGQAKGVIVGAEFLQNELWKRFTLMTGGYSIRNALDAQVRMTFGGTGSVLNHPLEYISLVVGKSKSKTIFGDSLMARGSLDDANSEINALSDDLRDRISSATRIRGMGSADYSQHLRGLGTFSDVQRSMPKNGMKLHTEGVIQQLAKINKSPLSRAAARASLVSGSKGAIVRRVVDEMLAPKNESVYKDIKKLFMQGIEESDSFGNVVRFPSVDIDEIARSQGINEVKKVLEVYAEKIVLGNAVTQTGNINSMRFVAGYDALPSMVNGDIERVVANAADLTDESGMVLSAGGLDVGQSVIMKDGRPGIIIQTASNKGVGTVVPVLEKGSVTNFRSGTQYLQKMVMNTPLYDAATGNGLPVVVSREITGSVKADMDNWAKMQESMDVATKWFFVSLNARSSRTLERSPVFRKQYYENVFEHVDQLSQKSASELISTLTNKAGSKDDIGKYIGNDELLPRLEAIVGKASHDGNLTAKNLDEYAKALSLNQMENLLFDASNTNNLFDILRIVVPFGNAWSEVVGHYLSNSLVDGVHKYRTFSRFYTGAVNADPDQDGRGFFYKDPQTNELMFSFPMSGSISKLITGGDYTAGLASPVKRLSQGINVYPGIGPFAQIGANRLLADTPQNDEIRQMLLPYGAPSALSSVLPGWTVKMMEALAQDRNRTNTVFANTWFETIKAEANTGKYDLTLPEERERIKDVAAEKAKWITMMRAMSQFIGPTSGQAEFKVPTDQGDVYVREIVKEFYNMQQEDYDSAVERFLKLHGENAALYVSSKSRAVAPGLETTDDFGDWTRNNQDLINGYSRTAYYLAPAFGEFDFKTEARQRTKGERESLTADEMIELAQNRIGSSRYRAAKLALGAYPNKAQAERLAAFRVDLSKKYPGFKPKAEFVTNEYENDLVELGNLIKDSRVGWNPAVPAIEQYLNLRNMVIAQSGKKTLSSRSLAGKRSELFQFGESLAKSNIYFDRIWQRFLAQEVED